MLGKGKGRDKWEGRGREGREKEGWGPYKFILA